jgi:hypothetical protein
MSIKQGFYAPVILIVAMLHIVAGQARAQNRSPYPDVLGCSPSPCVLNPTQASEGGNGVVNAPIAADPNNPRHLLLGSWDANCSSPVGFHLSKDGGTSWDHVCMTLLQTPLGKLYPGGQPMVGYDRNGVAYIAAEYAGNEDVEPVVAFQKSGDGVTWSPPAIAMSAKNSTVAWSGLAVDTSFQSPWADNLYVSTVFVSEPLHTQNRVAVAHSRDGGTTWKQVAVAAAQIAPDIDNNSSITIGKDGTVYLTWMYCNVGPTFCANNRAYMVFSKSIDGGNTWTTPALMTSVRLPNPDWIPNTQDRVYNYPAIGVDNSSGPYAGNLYVVMYSWTGTYLRVVVIRSSDGGKTWSKPVPVAPPSANHDQFFPWLSVSSTGLVGVSWLDRRNDPANVKYQAFAAISRDGGQTFQPDVQLTTAFSDPTSNGEDWMGDYTGNTWAGPNNFIAAWMDNSSSFYMQDFVGGIRLK